MRGERATQSNNCVIAITLLRAWVEKSLGSIVTDLRLARS